VPESSAKRLEWAVPARLAYEATLERIADEDVETAALVERRVSRSLSLLRLQPGIGTPGTVAGRKTYAIPNTGHSVNYRIGRDSIIILRWYRQRQNVRR
jgi:plasmid stabilization system protein ParE